MHQLKYRGWHALGAVMGTALAQLQLPVLMQQSPLVQAVPTTAGRIKERGYNQAELIAAAFASATGRQCVHWLERAPSTSSQTALQPAKRAANVAGAFRLNRAAELVRGARVLVVDDVLTTGATVAECAEILAAAGAAAIHVLTYARALDTERLLGVL